MKIIGQFNKLALSVLNVMEQKLSPDVDKAALPCDLWQLPIERPSLSEGELDTVLTALKKPEHKFNKLASQLPWAVAVMQDFVAKFECHVSFYHTSTVAVRIAQIVWTVQTVQAVQ